MKCNCSSKVCACKEDVLCACICSLDISNQACCLCGPKIKVEKKITQATPFVPQFRGQRYIPENIRALVLERDGHKCAMCDSKESLQIDHIRPVAKGGQSLESNLQTLCSVCNRNKWKTWER